MSGRCLDHNVNMRFPQTALLHHRNVDTLQLQVGITMVGACIQHHPARAV